MDGGVTTRQQKSSQGDYQKIDEKLNKINSNINELMTLKNEFADLKRSMAFMSEKYDKFVRVLEDNKTEMKKMNKQLEELTNSNKEKDLKIKNLQEQLGNLEQYTRNHNIEICGIPHRPQEDCREIVGKLAKELQVDLRIDEIDIVHRTFTSNKSIPPPIVAKITTRSKRDLLTRKKKWIVTNRNVPQTEIGQTIYIQEHLTSANKMLLRLTKHRARESEYKYVWVKYGKILVRKNDNSPVIRINSEEDLQAKL